MFENHTALFSSNFSKKNNFRNHRLSGRMHPGAVQPEEEQAAAHHQPQQENHHLGRLVSPRTDFDIIPFNHQTWSRLGQSQNVNLYLMLNVSQCHIIMINVNVKTVRQLWKLFQLVRSISLINIENMKRSNIQLFWWKLCCLSHFCV